MFESYRNPKNVILEGYQPTKSGNVDPKRPPRGGSVSMMAKFRQAIAAKTEHPGSTPEPKPE